MPSWRVTLPFLDPPPRAVLVSRRSVFDLLLTMYHIITIALSRGIVLLPVLPPLLQVLNATPTASVSIRSVLPPLLVCLIPPHITQAADTLGEVDMYPSVIDQHTLHLEVCSLAGALVFELDESILEAVAGLPVADDLAG